MNYMNLIKASCEDFTGWSVVLQVSGCSNKCKNCFAKRSWNKNSGTLFDEAAYQDLVEAARKPFISNIVFQGGDCMFSSNVRPSINLFRRLRKELPDKKLVMFTGLTYEQIQKDLLRQPCLETLDFIIDGKYECDNPTTKPFRGSDNQILHTLKSSISIKQE